MTWTIRLDPRAQQDLSRLDHPIQKKLLHYLSARVATSEDPQIPANSLSGLLGDLWRFRVGDYRIATIDRGTITVLVLAAAHRKEIYKRISRLLP